MTPKQKHDQGSMYLKWTPEQNMTLHPIPTALDRTFVAQLHDLVRAWLEPWLHRKLERMRRHPATNGISAGTKCMYLTGREVVTEFMDGSQNALGGLSRHGNSSPRVWTFRTPFRDNPSTQCLEESELTAMEQGGLQPADKPCMERNDQVNYSKNALQFKSIIMTRWMRNKTKRARIQSLRNSSSLSLELG